MQGISWLAEDLLASQEGLCTMKLEVIYVKCEVFLVLIRKADRGIRVIALLILNISTT
jgi:hypothetical protein